MPDQNNTNAADTNVGGNERPVTEAERREAGERQAEARGTPEEREARLREVIRSELHGALQVEARATGASRQEQQAAARNVDEYAEQRAHAETQYEQALVELARQTGSFISTRSPVAQHYRAAARGFASERQPTIIDRLRNGDPKPAIRTLKYFRAIADGNIAEARKYAGRALSAQVGASGGLLVPEEFSADVIMKLGELTPFATREFMRIIPMANDTMRVPRVITLPAATYGEENTSWTTDDGKGTEPQFGEVELVARDAMLIVGAPENLFEDAGPDVLALLVDLFGGALARLRNQKILLGNGANEPEGVIGAAGVTNSSFVNTDQSTKQTSINTWFHDVKEQYRGPALFCFSDAALEVFSNIRATTGEPVMTSILDEPFMRLRGKPVFTTDALTTTGVFGNFMFYLFGDRQAMQTATDRGGSYFNKRQIGVRVVERYDGKIAQAEAFATMDSIS